MAFIPIIDFCLVKDSSDVYKISPDDKTGVYDASSNTTGWENASTLLGGDVTAASLAITDPDDITTTINVLSQIPDPVTGNISFTDIGVTDGIAIKDGLYKILYTVTDGNTTWTDCVQKYFYKDVKCCISKMVKKLMTDPDNKTLIADVNKVKAWETVLSSAASTLDVSTADKYLTLLKDYCDYKACNCKSK